MYQQTNSTLDLSGSNSATSLVAPGSITLPAPAPSKKSCKCGGHCHRGGGMGDLSDVLNAVGDFNLQTVLLIGLGGGLLLSLLRRKRRR